MRGGREVDRVKMRGRGEEDRERRGEGGRLACPGHLNSKYAPARHGTDGDRRRPSTSFRQNSEQKQELERCKAHKTEFMFSPIFLGFSCLDGILRHAIPLCLTYDVQFTEFDVSRRHKIDGPEIWLDVTSALRRVDEQ